MTASKHKSVQAMHLDQVTDRQAIRRGGASAIDRQFEQPHAIDEPESFALANPSKTLAVLETFTCCVDMRVLRHPTHTGPGIAVMIVVDDTRQILCVEFYVERIDRCQFVGREVAARNLGRNRRKQVASMKGLGHTLGFPD